MGGGLGGAVGGGVAANRLRKLLPAGRHSRATPAYKCPAAPYEAAMLIEDALQRRGVRGAVQLDLYAAEPGPMGVAGPQVSAAVRQVVESKGITHHPEHQVVSVDPSARRLVFANGTNADFDLLVYVPPHRAPAVVRNAGLGNERVLDRLQRELRLLNASAAASLDEGLEETLTLHRLGVFPALGVSFNTTNLIESVMARLEAKTRRATERQFRRVKGHRQLPLLKQALHARLSLTHSVAA